MKIILVFACTSYAPYISKLYRIMAMGDSKLYFLPDEDCKNLHWSGVIGKPANNASE